MLLRRIDRLCRVLLSMILAHCWLRHRTRGQSLGYSLSHLPGNSINFGVALCPLAFTACLLIPHHLFSVFHQPQTPSMYSSWTQIRTAQMTLPHRCCLTHQGNNGLIKVSVRGAVILSLILHGQKAGAMIHRLQAVANITGL